MKQQVVIVASEDGMKSLAPITESAEGAQFEHIANPKWAATRLTESIPELLILVHPLPDYETVTFWEELKQNLQSAMPLTVVVAPTEHLVEVDPLRGPGVRLVELTLPAGDVESALSSFLRKAPRPHARVMVKMAVEVGAGKILRFAQTVNVSRSGLLIRTREQFPAGSSLDLKMELPGDNDPIEAHAEVVRMSDPEVEDVHGIGARFVSFRHGHKRRFDEFMHGTVAD